MSARSNSAAHQQGVTLVELMIVILIAGIMLAIAVPMFSEGLERNRRLSALESTVGMLASARSEAVARSTTVSLCPSADGKTCSTDKWEQGVLMFEDNGNTSPPSAPDRARTGSEEIIRTFDAARGQITIRSKGGFTNLDGIVFDELGRVEDKGSLVICDSTDPATALGVVINASGQARLASDDDDNGVIDIDTGNLGSCP